MRQSALIEDRLPAGQIHIQHYMIKVESVEKVCGQPVLSGMAGEYFSVLVGPVITCYLTYGLIRV